VQRQQRQISNGLVVLNFRGQMQIEHSLASLPMDFYYVAAQLYERSSNSSWMELAQAIQDANLQEKHKIQTSDALAAALWRDYCGQRNSTKQEVLL
jgi:hypothetical protein